MSVFEAVDRDARLSDKVTEAILQTIVSNRLKPGDALPPERELGKQFGVSRTVIREAIRALHAKGLPRKIRVKLTIAHADNNPANMDDLNLRCWCTWCHLHHDQAHHKETRRARKDRGRPLLVIDVARQDRKNR